MFLLCRLSGRWRSITCLSEMAQVLKSLVKNLCSYFLQWELIIIIQIKSLILLLLNYGILYKPPKWPVLYDKCIRKSMVVCNLKLIRLIFSGRWLRLTTPLSDIARADFARIKITDNYLFFNTFIIWNRSLSWLVENSLFS